VLHVNSKVISKKQSKSHGRQIKDSEHRKERERERDPEAGRKSGEVGRRGH
jgi:hypothetical protein